MRALLRDSRKKLAEVQRTAKAVDIISSRLTAQNETAIYEVADFYNYVPMQGERPERSECAKSKWCQVQVALQFPVGRIHRLLR